jgi:hypothetical protein
MIAISGSQSIKVRLASAAATNQLPVIASFTNLPLSNSTRPEETSYAFTNDTTDVDIVISNPINSSTRGLKYFNLKNSDTATVTVFISLFDDVTEIGIGRWTLSLNDTLCYDEGNGWQVIDNVGRIKVTGSASGGATDLGFGVITGTTMEITSSTGLSVILPSATATEAGLLPAADKVFIDYENSAAEGIVAFATGGQAGATVLTAKFNAVDTVGTAGDSVKTIPAVAAKEMIIYNSTANDADLFPAIGEEFFNGTVGLGVDVQVVLGAGNSIRLISFATGKWRL